MRSLKSQEKATPKMKATDFNTADLSAYTALMRGLPVHDAPEGRFEQLMKNALDQLDKGLPEGPPLEDAKVRRLDADESSS